MKRGGLCTYAAVLQIVHHRQPDRMLIFMGTAAWATLIILPLSWFWPNLIKLSHTHHFLTLAIIGGGVLGVGAFLNKGCFFGTFVQLVSGNLNYLATLFGLSAGVVVTQLFLSKYIPATSITTNINTPNSTGFLWLTGMSAFALFMASSNKPGNDRFVKKLAGFSFLNWKKSFPMIAIGIGGGLLYGTVNGWNYADVLTNSILKLINKEATGPGVTALISTIAMVAGGIVAAVTAEKFAIKPTHYRVIINCFIGGLLMGAAARLTPGGNDGLLLKGIPGFAQHAIIGYLTMVIVMLLLVYLFRRNGSDYQR